MSTGWCKSIEHVLKMNFAGMGIVKYGIIPMIHDARGRDTFAIPFCVFYMLF